MSYDRNLFFLEEMIDNLRYDVAPHLSEDDFIYLGQANKFFHTLFRDQYKNALRQNLKELFEHTLVRDQDSVGDILHKFPDLLFRKATVSELFLDEEGNRRRFNSISPLQYVVWARDIPMLYWMLLYGALFYAPELEKFRVVGWIEDIKKAVEIPPWLTYSLDELRLQVESLLPFVPLAFVSDAVSQIDELKINGTEHGARYNWSPLSSFSKDYRQCYQTYKSDPAAHQLFIEASWRSLCLLQYKSVLHVIHEYCRHDKKATQLTFNTDYLPRTHRVCNEDNYLKKLESLHEYGIYRGESYPAMEGIYCSTSGEAQEQDGIMIETLFAAREIQLNSLYELMVSHQMKSESSMVSQVRLKLEKK